MATFSTNQARQLFVALDVDTVDSSASAGTIAANSGDNCLYFTYMGADGIIRSDLVNKNCVIDVRATNHGKLGRKLAQYKVALDSTVNSGNPVANQDYILGFTFYQWGSLGLEDQYYKDVCVRATSGMTAAQFYTALANACTAAFAKESIPLLTFSAAATYVLITEVEQPWVLGKKSSDPLQFTISPRLITYNSNEYIWGTVTATGNGSAINNGKLTADLEWFCMGERGDIYRQVGYPYTIDTTYLVDPSKPYDYIDIDYYFEGEGVTPQKSQKMLTIVVPYNDSYTDVNSLITSINSALGTSVSTLS
jgi:hypothetical protein